MTIIALYTGCKIKNQEVRTSNTTLSNDSLEYLSRVLEDIGDEDQILRRLIACAKDNFGYNSDQIQTFYNVMAKADSMNVIKVRKIIDKYGWLGISQVGANANRSQWLVIQHASLKTQEKYLPLMRKSFKDGESKGSQLALLEDRILMRKGEKQLYGSQVRINPQTGEYYLYPIKDSLKVDKRRLEMGMEPLSDYLSNYNIEYK